MNTIRVSEYVIDRVAREGVKHVFIVSGGGGMFLLDSIGRRKDIEYICNHHEQASALAAEAYPRITGNLGVAMITTGPAGTNALTGVMCAWTDSIPLLVISGQARSTHLVGDTGLRQRGFHEANISKIVETVTKYAVTVRDPKQIAYHMDKAIFLAKNGRPGPTWVDLPVDIQGAMVEPGKLERFDAQKEFPEMFARKPIPEIKQIVELLKQARRPILLAGHGLKLTNQQQAFLDLAEAYGIPVATTRSTFDIIHADHPLRAGFVGIYGQRAANFAVQNSDLVLVLGSRLVFLVVGYETHLFAREAKKIVVDIDPTQLKHALIKVDVPVLADLREFMPQLRQALKQETLPDWSPWVKKIQHWREIFPNVTPAMRAQEKYVNPYHFYDVLSEEMSADQMMIWDQGVAFYASSVAFRVKKGQKSFSNVGFTPMGYGLPAAIGACFANGKKPLVCVHGDGGLQMNVQELQTVWHHKLPIKLFVFSNEGYTSIKHTQQQYFSSFFVGSDPGSGVTCPDTLKIAAGYQLPAIRVENHSTLRQAIRQALDTEGPFVVDVLVDPLAPTEPRVRSERLPDGKMVSKPLEDMAPYLDRDLFHKEMIVKPVS